MDDNLRDILSLSTENDIVIDFDNIHISTGDMPYPVNCCYYNSGMITMTRMAYQKDEKKG